jgi:O-antigen/teichoic acid export membrane protein
LKRVKTIARTPLFKVTSLNGVSVLLRIGSGLITSKLLAIFIGPSGMALVGNLRNFLTATETVGTLGFQNGVVKYVVELKADAEGLRRFIATVFLSLIAVVLALALLLFFLAQPLSAAVFGSGKDYAAVFRILALALPWYVVSVMLLALINGLGKFREVIRINIWGNVIGLLLSALMIWKLGTFGALLSLVLPPALLFFISFYFINKEIRFVSMLSFAAFDAQVIKNLSAYSLMTLVAALCGPLVLLAIRNNIIANLGIEQAGYWEAMNRLSTYYLMFISSILSVYFFPKLAFATNDKATKNVFRSYYTGIMPLFALGLGVLYLLRSFIVHTLFTPEFLPVTALFAWQLVGDVFKAASLILGYQFFAKKLTVAFIITELLSLTLLYVLSRLLTESYGIEGVVMAHAFTYFVYLLVLVWYFRKRLF